MINESINIYKDAEALSEGFTSFLMSEMEERDGLSISLSGGSTPKALFEHWSANYSKSIDWQRISFFWGDERCVPPGDSMSNYGMTKRLLFDKVEKIDKSKIYRIHGEDNIQDEIGRYESLMNRHLPKENGIPCFDIMMLGMGDDGHTVSIFPNRIDLWDNANNCVQAEHPETGMKRISLTGRVVNNAANIAFLVTGKNKAEKVRQIIERRESFMNIYPAARVNPVHGNLYWFLDEEAAGQLSQLKIDD